MVKTHPIVFVNSIAIPFVFTPLDHHPEGWLNIFNTTNEIKVVK